MAWISRNCTQNSRNSTPAPDPDKDPSFGSSHRCWRGPQIIEIQDHTQQSDSGQSPIHIVNEGAEFWCASRFVSGYHRLGKYTIYTASMDSRTMPAGLPQWGSKRTDFRREDEFIQSESLNIRWFRFHVHYKCLVETDRNPPFVADKGPEPLDSTLLKKKILSTELAVTIPMFLV